MKIRTMLAGAAALMMGTALFFLFRPAEPAPISAVETGGDVPGTQSTELLPEPSEPLWVVGVWQGQVAVFRSGALTPETVLDMPVAALPEQDRDALEQGISVSDREALAALLEDYGS